MATAFMIEFEKQPDILVLKYSPSSNISDERWVEKSLVSESKVVFSKTFTFRPKDSIFSNDSSPDDATDADIFDAIEYRFLFGVLEGQYYKIVKGVLIDSVDIYLQKDLDIQLEFFVADANISIFRTLEPLLTNDLYIGGNHPEAMAFETFNTLLLRFPTQYEKKKYMQARISAVLREEFGSLRDGETSYNQYMNRKFNGSTSNGLQKTFKETDTLKYKTIFNRLEDMLSCENEYSEKQWQEEILQILLLVYPKYIYVFREVPIKDHILKDRFLDYLLIDAAGYTDIVEIKKPFGKSILTENTYRQNFIPLRELSGTIMQIEKYIYYLNRWARDGEKYLTEKYSSQLPVDFHIKITNPGGIVIMGRDNNLTIEQKADFEVVKRKYKNVIDILTYDNLLLRLKHIIDSIVRL